MLLLLLAVVLAGEVVAQVDTLDSKTARDYYERGLKRENAKQFDEALADYQRTGDLNPKLFDAHFSCSTLFAEMKGYRNAIAALTASLKARPKSYSALFNRGLYHQYLREYDDAINDYTRTLAEDADFSHDVSLPQECRAHAHHYRGRVYQWFKEDDVNAIADYTAALRLDPKIEMVRYRRGQAYQSVKEFAKAHKDFEQAAGTAMSEVRQNIVLWTEQGESSDDIVSAYTQLTLGDVHAALAFYHDNRSEMDQLIQEDGHFIDSIS